MTANKQKNEWAIPASGAFILTKFLTLLKCLALQMPKDWKSDQGHANTAALGASGAQSLPRKDRETQPLANEAQQRDNEIQWLGHATIALKIGDARILTDPHFSERASPFSWIGPKRLHPAP